MRLGEIIKRYREENGLSLRDFAKKSGVSNSYLSMLETGRQPQSGRPIVPTLTTLNKIASAVGMRIDDLIAAVDDMPVSFKRRFARRFVVCFFIYPRPAAAIIKQRRGD